MVHFVSLFVMMVAMGPGAGGPPPAPDTRVIDLNRASFEELLAFEGIGRLYADKIVRARPFASRRELVDRHVLPPAVYSALKHRFHASPVENGEESRALDAVPAGMLDLNQATAAELAAVPGIGRQYADRVVAGRPYRNEAELVARRVVPLTVFRRIEGYVAVQR